MRSISKFMLVLLVAGSLLQACAGYQPVATGADPAMESSIRTQIVAEITMTAAQNALGAAQATAASAQETLAAPTAEPPVVVPTTTLPPSQPAILSGIVASSKMQLRDGPDVRFSPVADCFAGTTVFLLGKYGEWVYVQLENGLKGWAYYGWLKFPSGIELDDLPDAILIPNLVIPHKYP